MRDIVIVPAWRRAAFLAATLELLALTDDASQEYWLSLDRGYDRQTLEVANTFARKMGGRSRVLRRMHPYRGNSYNVLESYREAVARGPELVHLVEEDVFVGMGYFDAHREAHALCPDVMAVSLARNQNHIGDPEPEPDALYLAPVYQSVAVSFRPERLEAVLKYATRAYYSNPIQYCRTHFPHTTIPAGNAEQDGLINRVAERLGLRVAYATLPRAYHAGFVGYHRKGEGFPVGMPVTAVATALIGMSTAELNRRAHSYPDHQAIDLREGPGPLSRIVDWSG